VTHKVADIADISQGKVATRLLRTHCWVSR